MEGDIMTWRAYVGQQPIRVVWGLRTDIAFVTYSEGHATEYPPRTVVDNDREPVLDVWSL
jgi:hypothetical protein